MLIDFHTHKSYNDKTLFVRSYMINETPKIPNHLFTIGLHPWFASNLDIQYALSTIETFCKSKNCIAIGEIGLDKTRNNFDAQLKTFLEQLELAQSISKPVVIHTVHSYELILAFRKQYKLTPWAIHGFNGNKTTALQLVKKDIFLSFGYNILKPSQKVYQAFISTPIDKIFLETDTREIHIKDIYDKAQKYMNKSLEQQTQLNFSTFTNKKQTNLLKL